MAKDKYFDLRQSTRAYQNPYEAGGIGVGGLTQSARYNRQQVGSSFLSAPTGVNTWSKGPSSRSMGRGGMVDMPTDGPTPLGGAPDRPQRMGPAGPSAMASGVAGRFERPSENTFEVTGRADKVASTLVSALGAAAGAKLMTSREKREARKNAKYDMGATLEQARRNRGIRMSDLKRESDKPEIAGPNDVMVGKRTGFYDLPTAQERVDKVLRIAGQNRPDPSLYGSGQSLEDINLKYGLPTSGLKALGAGDPTIERPASGVGVTESMGRSRFGPLREPTGGPIPVGGVPDPVMTTEVLASQPRALPSGNQRRVDQSVDEPQAPGPGPETGLPRPTAARSGRTNTRSYDAERERQARNRSNIPPNWR